MTVNRVDEHGFVSGADYQLITEWFDFKLKLKGYVKTISDPVCFQFPLDFSLQSRVTYSEIRNTNLFYDLRPLIICTRRASIYTNEAWHN